MEVNIHAVLTLEVGRRNWKLSHPALHRWYPLHRMGPRDRIGAMGNIKASCPVRIPIPILPHQTRGLVTILAELTQLPLKVYAVADL